MMYAPTRIFANTTGCEWRLQGDYYYYYDMGQSTGECHHVSFFDTGYREEVKEPLPEYIPPKFKHEHKIKTMKPFLLEKQVELHCRNSL